MPRQVYSKMLFAATGVTGISSGGVVPDGYTWVVRFFAATFGDYLGYVRTAIGPGLVGPWLWLATSRQTALIGVSKQTFFWEGRVVIPQGYDLGINVDNPDTCDVYVSGYVLSNDGS